MARQFDTLVQGCRKLLSPNVQVKQFSHSMKKNKFTNVCGFEKCCMEPCKVVAVNPDIIEQKGAWSKHACYLLNTS